MRKLLLTAMTLALSAIVVFAQDRTVSGQVTTSDDGSSLPGVNVILKGSE